MAPSHRRAGSHKAIVRRDDFPAFVGFARGYLHEDLAQTHGSADDAMRAFCEDADELDRRRLLVELEILVRLLEPRSLAEQRRALARDLGMVWRPGGKHELAGLLDILRARATARPDALS